MILFLSITGILLSAILLLFNAKNNKSTIYLGIFFFLISLYAFYEYILLYSKSVFLVSIFLFNIAIDSAPLYLIGPMLYWYFRSVLTDNHKLKRSDIWHFLPMIIFFITTLPHAFIPWNDKVEIAKTVVEDPSIMESYSASSLNRFVPQYLLYLSRPLLIMGYTIWSLALFIKYLVKNKTSKVLSKQHFMKKWLCLLLGSLLLLEVTHILLISKAFKMHFSELYFTINILWILSGAGLIGLLVSPFFFPNILYGLPRMTNLTFNEKHQHKLDIVYQPNKIPIHNHFENSYLYSIGQMVDACMKEYKPYLQLDCNLSHLAKYVNLPVHHLAYYFKEVKKQHFTDYRNEWRINHAKTLIREGKIKLTTLENIGFESGFTNRNTFLNAFKKVEGISPHVFAMQIRSNLQHQ